MSAVVEDEIDTGKLLKSLDSETGESAKTVAILTLEAIEVRRAAQTSSVVDLTGNFSVFFCDLRRVDIDTENSSEGNLSLFVLSSRDQPPRGLRKEAETCCEDGGPSELDTDRDGVTSEIVSVFGSVNDNCSNEKTNGDHPLVGTDDHTTDVTRSTLRLVHGNNAGSSSYSQSSEDTTNDEDRKCFSSCLKSYTDTEENEVCHDSESPSNFVGDSSGEKRSDEGSGGKDRSNQGIVTR